MQFLAKYPIAASIASEDIRNLRNALKTDGRGRQYKITAEDIKEAAKCSVGEDNIAVALEVQSIIAIIATRKQQIKKLENKIEEFSLKLNSPIISIPGISHITGMTIIAEIGDIHDFSDAAHLISYAGMEPSYTSPGSTMLHICQYPSMDHGTCAKHCIKRFLPSVNIVQSSMLIILRNVIKVKHIVVHKVIVYASCYVSSTSF